MKPLSVFIGLCGSVRNGYESSSRGEGRWALSLVRCLKDIPGIKIVMAPDTEPCDWGTCDRPDNVLMIQSYEKWRLDKAHFDLAIFTSWQTHKPEMKYIHADKYLWGVMGWKHEIMKDGYFQDNEYVIRWFRADLPEIPYPINFQDRCFLLAQPFGPAIGENKFDNKRIAWVAKEAFLDTTNPSLSESAARHLFAVVDVCKETGAALSIFSCHEFNPVTSPKVVTMGILDKLKEYDNITMYPSLPYPEYQRELQKCSVTIPLAFAGSTQEAIFCGLVPMLYKDSMFSNHPHIIGVCNEMTQDKVSRFQSEDGKKDVLNHEEIKDVLRRLLTDYEYFTEMLGRLTDMVQDNLDMNVMLQLQDIIDHKKGIER